ncbi:MAG TPA: (d)CMP kinase [Thermoanaerobaculia bacterium]|nr:(d)CMP kinase [Thermoanaerobaculia bacterium]
MTGLIVAIDGPSGVGKTSTSKELARRLGVPHIDTGAMYRAIALKAIRESVSFDDGEALTALASGAAIAFQPAPERPRILLDGEDVTDAIREPEVSMAASRISAVPPLRRILVELQQQLGRQSGGVLEGRDIGTKVFPDTPYKFFLTARPEVRALRRHRELHARGIELTVEEVLAEMLARDRQDSTRADSPLTYDSSYTLVDTSDLTIREVVEVLVDRIRA